MEGKSKLSKPGLYAYTIGYTVGSGMFLTLPAAIGLTGASVILAMLLACIMSFMSYFYILAVSSYAPIKGGEYGHIMFSAPTLIGGVFGLSFLLYIFSYAYFMDGALTYIGLFVPFIGEHVKLLTVVGILLFLVIDYIGLELGAKVQEFMTGVLLICFLLFIVFGVQKIDFSVMTGTATPFFANGISGFAKAIALCIWVIAGIGGGAVTFVEEVNNPTRTIPKCILGVTTLLGIFSIAIVFVCAGAVPTEVSAQGLNAVAEVIFPGWLYVLFCIGGAAFALLGTNMSLNVIFRKLILKESEDGFLPKFMGMTNKKGYPVVGMGVLLVVALVPYLTGLTVDNLVAYSDVPIYLVALVTNLYLYQLPKKYPQLWEKSILHMPLTLWYVVVSIAVACSALLMYCCLANYSLVEALPILILVVVVFAWSFYRMKSGHVDSKALEKEKEEIIKDALESASQSN